jgi:hypothetical protein
MLHINSNYSETVWFAAKAIAAVATVHSHLEMDVCLTG